MTGEKNRKGYEKVKIVLIFLSSMEPDPSYRQVTRGGRVGGWLT